MPAKFSHGEKLAPIEVAPVEMTAWKFEGNTTRTVIVIAFDATVAAGATVWLTARWYNPRAMPGPVAGPISTSLAGGLSLAA